MCENGCCSATFSSKLSVVYSGWFLSRGFGGTFPHSSLQCCINSLRFCRHLFLLSFLKVPPQHSSQAEVWTLDLCNSLVHLFNYFKPFCFRRAAAFGIVVLQHRDSAWSELQLSNWRAHIWLLNPLDIKEDHGRPNDGKAFRCECKISPHHHPSTAVLLSRTSKNFWVQEPLR